MRFCRVAGALAATVSTLALAGAAGASGFQVRENSAAYQGTAFAGQASGRQDLSVMFSNPATMTQFSGTQTEAVASGIIASAKFEGTATRVLPATTVAPVGADGENDAGAGLFVPAGYLMHSLTPDLKIGVSLTSPYGLITRYEPGWVGRYNALKSELMTVDVNPSVAYRVAPWLSVGGGVSIQYADAELSRALNFAFLGAPDGRFVVEGDSLGYGFNAGVLLQPFQGTNIGLAYRSQIHHRLEGKADFSVVPGVAAALGSAVADSDATAEYRSPATATASLTQAITPAIDVMAEVQWTNWESFKELVVVRDDTTALTTQPEHWRNTVFVALGAAWRLDDAFTLRAGTAWDMTPVKDEFRTARVPDNDRFWISLGLGYKLSEALQIDAGYSHIFTRPATIDETTPSGTGAPTPTGARLVGTYKGGIDIIAVSAKLRF